MSIIQGQNKRRPIPTWKSLSTAAQLGELRGFGNKAQSKNKFGITEYLTDWKKNKSISFAGDLISAAFVMDIRNKDINEACHFVIANETISPKSLISLARRILSGPYDRSAVKKGSSIGIEGFLDRSNLDIVISKIRILKKYLRQAPDNPFTYVEIARMYSIIGQHEKSIKSIEIALKLAPNNRFILRSAIRLLYNLTEYELGHYYLLKSDAVKYDPWIMASEISIATVRNKTSKLIKRGIKFIENRKFIPFDLSELASAIGTVEATYGSRKSSKKLFNTALIQPNDNSLAQAEWVSNEFELFNIELDNYDSHFLTSEVKTLNSFFDSNWTDTVRNSVNWFLDMPNNKDPLLLGANVSSFGLSDNKQAADLMKVALICFPNDLQILNNVSYYLAVNNEADSAKEFIDEALKHININNSSDTMVLCLLATNGLVNYRLGNLEAGRKYYEKAIEGYRGSKKGDHHIRAVLNFVREELNIGGEIPVGLIDLVKKQKSENLALDLQFLRKKVLHLYEHKM